MQTFVDTSDPWTPIVRKIKPKPQPAPKPPLPKPSPRLNRETGAPDRIVALNKLFKEATRKGPDDREWANSIVMLYEAAGSINRDMATKEIAEAEVSDAEFRRALQKRCAHLSSVFTHAQPESFYKALRALAR